MSKKIPKNRVFSVIFSFKLNLLKICPVSRKTDHMILKLNISVIKYNKNFQFGTYSFRVISSQKLFFEHQGKKQVI